MSVAGRSIIVAPAPVWAGASLQFFAQSSFSLKTKNGAKNWDGALEYSVDLKNWTQWSGSGEITSGEENGFFYIYLRGRKNTVISGSSGNGFVLTGSAGSVSCLGNAETLLDYPKVALGEHPSMGTACFKNLFKSCTALYSAPYLPSEELSQRCYESMFEGCTRIQDAPSLPASALAGYCYYRMFYGCRGMTSIPELPAAALQTQCYAMMFFGCTGIKLSASQTGAYVNAYRIPSSGSGSSASNALTDMFSGTGGTFRSTPSINTTYYTSNSVVS